MKTIFGALFAAAAVAKTVGMAAPAPPPPQQQHQEAPSQPQAGPSHLPQPPPATAAASQPAETQEELRSLQDIDGQILCEVRLLGRWPRRKKKIFTIKDMKEDILAKRISWLWKQLDRSTQAELEQLKASCLSDDSS